MAKIVVEPFENVNIDQAAAFIVEGMHIDRYIKHEKFQHMYSKLMFRRELSEATTALEISVDGKFEGFLLAKFNDEEKVTGESRTTLYQRFMHLIQKIVGSDKMMGPYGHANMAMLQELSLKESLDGEINLFAVDSQLKKQGLGTKLLDHLAAAHSGDHVFVYSDSDCNYQFYLHRGFQQAGSRQIVMDSKKSKLPLTCYLFDRIL